MQKTFKKVYDLLATEVEWAPVTVAILQEYQSLSDPHACKEFWDTVAAIGRKKLSLCFDLISKSS